MNLILRFVAITLTAGLGAWCGPVSAQVFPVKPIRIVVATVAGAGPDIATRQAAMRLADILRQPVVVENRPGANGMLAANEVAKAPADGYTLLNANIGNALNDVLRPASGAARMEQELIPITDITASPLILVVHSSVPVQSLKELLELARARPGGLNYASGGPGSLIQLTGERIKLATRVNIVEVPYKSFGADIADLLAGHVQVGFGVWGNLGPHIRAGKLRALGVASQQRLSAAPEIPTLAEAGIPDIVATGWNGVFAPAGTPAAVVQTLSRGFMAALATPEFRDFFARDGVEMGGKTPEQFSSFIRNEKAGYAKVIRDANIKLD
jgi:tripartite-type tricarboxylate transporter receptor subunit TctC